MRKIYFVLLISTIAFSCMAQNVGEAFYIYRNDGQFNAFFRDEVLSIEYSNYDLDSLLHEDWQTQVIYTEDSIYRIPLTVIDSVSFVKPEATYKEDVTYLGASLFDYIVSVNGQDIIFRSDTPEYLLPKIGNKIATVDLTDIFPYGFLGIVSAIDNVYDGIRIRCNSLALEDAVSRFYCIIQFNSHQESYSKHRAYYSRRPLKIKDFGPITIPYQVPNTLFERKDVMGFGGQASFTFALDPDLDIIFTIAIDDNEDVLSYNARINHAVQYTVDEEIVGAISKEWKETFYSQDFPLIWGFTFYFDLGLKAELSGELALGYHSSTSLRSGLDLTYYPKKPLDSKIVRWLYKSDGEDNLLYLAGKAEGKLGGYFGMGIGLVDHGLAKFGCEFELGIKGTAEFSLNLGELADNTSTSCYDKCKDQKADLSLYLGAYLVASLFEGDNKMIDDYEGGKGWWDDFSVQFSYGEDWNIAKLYEGYMLPQFEHVSLLRHDDDKTEADASYTIPYNSIQKCKIGFVLYDSEGYFVEQKFYPEYYSNKTESSPLYPLTFTGLNPKEVYTIYPCINVLENDMLASPKYSENMVLLLLNDADEVELNSAKLSGRVVPNDGWKGRKVYFQYTKVPKYIGEVEKWETVDATYDEELKSYSLMLTDLIPATNYKYRMNCDNYGEELYSEEKTFKTNDYEVTVDNVTVKNPYSASLSGRILGYDPSQGHVYFNYTTDWTNGTWNEVDANYDAGTGLFTVKLTGLKPATKYFFKLIYVIYEDIYESIPFNFVTNDLSRELPVIFKFQQTSSMYQPDGFTYKGDTYSFEYGSAVTCQWSEAENAEDFGYVYEDLKGDTAHVSMKPFTSPYLDSRYLYYRNEPQSYARLYGYVKYYGDDSFYHGEKTDYPLIYDKQPEATTLEPIFIGLTSAKVKCRYKNVARWGGTCGVEYWEGTNIKDSKKIYFDTIEEEIEILLNDLNRGTDYHYRAIITIDDEQYESDVVQSFTTNDFVVIVNDVTEKSPHTASLSGQIQGYDPSIGYVYFYYTTDWNSAIWIEAKATYNEVNGIFTTKLENLKPATRYFYKLSYVVDENIYENIPFGFVTNDLSNDLPNITYFEQTSSLYLHNGFTYKEESYSFKYDSEVLIEWNDAESVEDWGYVYEDLNGDTAHVSMKPFTSPYLDSRYLYYRNEPQSYAHLYGYIKYYGDDSFYHGEKTDYPLIYDKQPEATTLEPTCIDETWATIKCGYENAVPWNGICGVEYWKDNDEHNEIIFELAQDGEFEIKLTGLSPNSTYYYRAFIKIADKFFYAEDTQTIKTPREIQAICPNNHHPHMIDLGLPSGTKWACCNVGANSPEEYGGYYCWGETKEKSYYDWDTYQYGYYDNNNNYQWVNIGSDIAGTSYDAATANWGAPWRMPTTEQCQELFNHCESVLTTQDGVSGRKFTGPNGNTIFLPTAGYRWVSDPGRGGCYWLSTLSEGYLYNADFIDLYLGGRSGGGRLVGRSVRPVQGGIKVTTGDATDIKTTSATLNGTVENLELATEDVTLAFLYSTDEDILNSSDYKTIEVTNDSEGNLTTQISELTDYTTYYYAAAYKLGDADYVLGEVKSFTTSVTVTTIENPEVTVISATLQGICSKGVSIAGFFVKKDGDTEYTQYDAYPDEEGNFSTTIDGLDIETQYVYYAFAQVNEQTYEGEEFSFTTKSLCPDNHHPHMIDLGLPSGTKWACCNVGAHKPEEYGGYYAWGETKEKSVYKWNMYQWYNDNNTGYVNIGSDIAGTSYDAATANWSDPWRMPSLEQCKELVKNCQSVWITQNSVYGRKFTGPNGGTIFLPAAGTRGESGLVGAGSYGYYWSSTLDGSDQYQYGAYFLHFVSGGVYWYVGARCYGNSIRPVSK